MSHQAACSDQYRQWLRGEFASVPCQRNRVSGGGAPHHEQMENGRVFGPQTLALVRGCPTEEPLSNHVQSTVPTPANPHVASDELKDTRRSQACQAKRSPPRGPWSHSGSSVDGPEPRPVRRATNQLADRLLGPPSANPAGHMAVSYTHLRAHET